MVLRSMAGTITRLAQQTVTLTRLGAVTVSAYGVATHAAATTTSGIRGIVTRPARHADLMHLPEGDRLQRSCSACTGTELRIGDLITLEDGEQYEIKGSSPHPYVGFWTGVGIKITEQ